MKLSTETLKTILVKTGYIKEPEFNDALQSATDLGRDVDDVLIFRGLIGPEPLAKIIAEHLKVQYIDPKRISIPNEILALVPEKLARSYRMIPIQVKEGQLILAMTNPTDIEAIELIKRHTGMSVVPMYATKDNVKRALGQYKRNIKKEFETIIQESAKEAQTEEDAVKAAEKLPIVKLLDTIIEYANAERASDIHIETQADNVIVRFRIDGILEDIIKLPRGVEEALVARIKILSNLKLDERRVPQDGRYKFVSNEDSVSLRISVIPGFYNENVVMRLLHESERPQSLDELGLTNHNLKLVNKNITEPNGLILITGPTGSGKTTTLYSILNILNTVKVKICTIEDPIEYGMPRISQIQANPKVGLTFAAGLRALLRHDPDIIMVGEIRDKETAEIAIHSALTGHLVLSTLHTNDAAGAIPRLLDMGVEGFLVASTVNVVVAQRLVRKICNVCLAPYKPEQAIIDRLTKQFNINPAEQKFYKGTGCDECGGSGFSGRIGIYEALDITDTIRNQIATKAISDEIQKIAVKEGMITMMRDGLNKVSAGLTTIEEVLKAVLES